MKYLLILLPLMALSGSMLLECKTYEPKEVTAAPIEEHNATKYPILHKDMAHQMPNGGIHPVKSRIFTLKDGKRDNFNGLVRLKSDNQVTNWEYIDHTNAYGLFEFLITDTNEFVLCVDDNGWVCLPNKLSINRHNKMFMKVNNKWERTDFPLTERNMTVKDGKIILTP